MKSYYRNFPFHSTRTGTTSSATALRIPAQHKFSKRSVATDYWPDLTTFTENCETSQLMYYPQSASRFSVCVNYRKLDRHLGCSEIL